MFGCENPLNNLSVRTPNIFTKETKRRDTAYSGFTPNVNQPVNTFPSSVINQNTER